MTELEPCPFCGGSCEAKHDIHMCDGWEVATIWCKDCGMYLQGFGEGKTPEESVKNAITRFNTRYERTCTTNSEMIYTYEGDIIDEVYKCSECGEPVCLQDNYCPNCGAKVTAE